MKKITNNASTGKIAMILNAVFFVTLIVAMITLLNFDKENVQLVSQTPHFEEATHGLQEAKQPMRGDSINIAYYTHKVDSLKSVPTPKDKKEAKALQEDLQRYQDILVEKEQQKSVTDSIVAEYEKTYLPLKEEYDQLTQTVEQKHKTFVLCLVLAIVLLVARIAFFAIWNYKNSQNLHAISHWMKYGSKPYWAWLGWGIPILHLVKPFSFFSEVWDETDYVLKDKAIVSKEQDSESDFLLGMWWGLWLICILLCTYILFATFFMNGPMYYKFGHRSVAIITLVIWALYLLIDTQTIRKYNKMNKQLVENESKLVSE